MTLSSPEILLYTIGAYGFTESDFFQTLLDAKIDMFCDIRARRGVRGSEYAFVNSTRLQARLAELGILYTHYLELAPDRQVRLQQYEKDKEAHVGKRQRVELSPEFKEAYMESRLDTFDSQEFLTSLGPEARRVVLFCVEGEAAACHRSLVAERLANDFALKVVHLSPP